MSNRVQNRRGIILPIARSNRWVILFMLCSVLWVPLTHAAAPGDLVIPRQEGAGGEEFMPPSVFPHWVHRLRFRCDACHDSLFEMELGATEITMDQMGAGESCGVCHNGQIAFDTGFEQCERCHNIAQE